MQAASPRLLTEGICHDTAQDRPFGHADLPVPTGLFAAPAISIDTDTPIVLMAYLYELSV